MLFGDSSTASNNGSINKINDFNDFNSMAWVELHDESRRSYFFLISLWVPPKGSPHLYFYPSFIYDGPRGCPEDIYRLPLDEQCGTYALEWLLVNSTDHACHQI